MLLEQASVSFVQWERIPMQTGNPTANHAHQEHIIIELEHLTALHVILADILCLLEPLPTAHVWHVLKGHIHPFLLPTLFLPVCHVLLDIIPLLLAPHRLLHVFHVALVLFRSPLVPQTKAFVNCALLERMEQLLVNLLVKIALQVLSKMKPAKQVAKFVLLVHMPIPLQI